MKKVSIVKASEVEIKPFNLHAFTTIKETPDKMKKITKKMLRELAQRLELDYNDKQITFTKKLMTAYLER